MSITTQQYGKMKTGLIAPRIQKDIDHDLTWHDSTYNRRIKYTISKDMVEADLQNVPIYFKIPLFYITNTYVYGKNQGKRPTIIADYHGVDFSETGFYTSLNLSSTEDTIFYYYYNTLSVPAAIGLPFDNSIKQVNFLGFGLTSAIGTLQDSSVDYEDQASNDAITLLSTKFNGSDAQIILNPFDGVPRGIGTLSFWAKQELVTDANFRDLFHLGALDSTTTSRVLRSKNNGIRLISPAGLPATFGTGSPYDLNVWHYYTMVMDGDSIKVYLDETKIIDVDIDAFHPIDTDVLYFGSGGNARYFRGNMSQLFFSTALRSEAYIQSTYRNLKNYDQYISRGEPQLEFIPLQ